MCELFNSDIDSILTVVNLTNQRAFQSLVATLPVHTATVASVWSGHVMTLSEWRTRPCSNWQFYGYPTCLSFVNGSTYTGSTAARALGPLSMFGTHPDSSWRPSVT